MSDRAPFQNRVLNIDDAVLLLGIKEATLWRILDAKQLDVITLTIEGTNVLGLRVGDLPVIVSTLATEGEEASQARIGELERLLAHTREALREREQAVTGKMGVRQAVPVGREATQRGAHQAVQQSLMGRLEEENRTLHRMIEELPQDFREERNTLQEKLQAMARELQQVSAQLADLRLEREQLSEKIELIQQVERATQAYCDRLENRSTRVA